MMGLVRSKVTWDHPETAQLPLQSGSRATTVAFWLWESDSDVARNKLNKKIKSCPNGH